MKVEIFHNPRCSKSRQALALLQAAAQEKALDIAIVEYLKTPPDSDRLDVLRDALGVSARDMMRQNESQYRALGLADETDEATLLAAMAAHPILIERPIVIVGKRAAICRPPELVETLLQSN